VIIKRGNRWCVAHGHDQKKDSETDRPKGAIIKCFNTKEEAIKMHVAIMLSEKKERKRKK
jgi:hypothetical protein